MERPHEAVAIDSLLSVDQYRGTDKAGSTGSDGKPIRDVAEVAAATEVILPKGSARTTSSVSHLLTLVHTHTFILTLSHAHTHTLEYTHTQLLR